MNTIARAPPVVGLALVLGAGSACIHLGVPLSWALLPVPVLLCLIAACHRPSPIVLGLLLAFPAGSISTWAWTREQARDCRLTMAEGEKLQLRGRLVGTPTSGMGELRPFGGQGTGPCRGTVRVTVPGGLDSLSAGAALEAVGRWRRTARPGRPDPQRSGYLKLDSLRVLAENLGEPRVGGLGDAKVRLGAWVQRRLAYLFPRTSGLALALLWARKDGLDPEIREAFARTGTAHLLAISGFHVGVVAGVLLLLLGGTGLPHSLRYAAATAGVWAYVAAIGLPAAASRAALMLLVLSAGRLLGRPISTLGALATAFLAFGVWDPGALANPGFQMSFAGVAGLALGYRPLVGRLVPAGAGGLKKALASGCAAGIVATLATLPLVAWHFGRVSLVGIPLTLAAAPLVSLAIPGAFASLLLSVLHPALGRFAAEGPQLLLEALAFLIRAGAALPLASVWVSKPAVASGMGALGVVLIGLRVRPLELWATRVRILAMAAAAGVLCWPLGLRWVQAGSMELVVLDVGQGDAVAVRSPRGRWVLVDAGPRADRYDAGARAVLPFLRSRGARSLALMVLTHPDMDHVGGSGAILRSFPVLGVADPGDPAGSDVFFESLVAAREAGVPWRALVAGDSIQIDGIAFRVLAPEEPGRGVAGGSCGEAEGNNARSLVLEVRYGAFSALLTGDAPLGSEDCFVDRLQSDRVQVLKVGHHGSVTSTGRPLLDRARPEIAIISSGRRNRFGHPHQEVLDRLERAGALVFRTDLLGNIVVRASADGRYEVR